MSIDFGRLFREEWIAGVRRHHPGEAKPGYVAPWEDMPQWEREAAAAVCQQVADFVAVSGGAVRRLSREQRGRFVAVCWIAQIYREFPEPKPSYVADWDEMPEWQRKVDADIFDAIERRIPSSGGPA
jgi:hypothetical protein